MIIEIVIFGNMFVKANILHDKWFEIIEEDFYIDAVINDYTAATNP